MFTVRFSVLSYYPSFITTENINIGILFQNAETNSVYFYTTQNWDRVRAFDDELNINFMKDYLKGISYEAENHLFNNNFEIEEYIKYFTNEYKFLNVQSVQCDDVNEFIEETKKIYLRFDYQKKERLSKGQEQKYIYKLLRSSNIEYTREKIKGYFDENIKYDYVIGEYAIKLFTFEGKSLSHLISSAKMWSFNAQEMKDKYKTIFIYDKEEKNIKYFDSIIRILSENAHKVMVFQEGIEYLLALKTFNSNKHNIVESKVLFNN